MLLKKKERYALTYNNATTAIFQNIKNKFPQQVVLEYDAQKSQYIMSFKNINTSTIKRKYKDYFRYRNVLTDEAAKRTMSKVR